MDQSFSIGTVTLFISIDYIASDLPAFSILSAGIMNFMMMSLYKSSATDE